METTSWYTVLGAIKNAFNNALFTQSLSQHPIVQRLVSHVLLSLRFFGLISRVNPFRVYVNGLSQICSY